MVEGLIAGFEWEGMIIVIPVPGIDLDLQIKLNKKFQKQNLIT